MFKFAHAFVLSALLVSTLNAADDESLPDVNSDAEAFQEDRIEDGDESIGEDRIEDGDENIGELLKRSPSQDAGCPAGFEYLPLAKSCYQVVYESHDWYAAAAKCQLLHPRAHLVAITSPAENHALTDFLSREKTNHHACASHDGGLFWTSGQRRNAGGNCMPNRNPFVWKISDSNHLAFTFTWWHRGEPKKVCVPKRNDPCLQISSGRHFGWRDSNCGARVCPLCEYTP